MDWSDEDYVRVYTRDTAELEALGWEAKALLWELLRKATRAGVIELGRTGNRGIASLTRIPLEVVERALPILLDDGCVVRVETRLVIPNYMQAQTTPRSDKARKRAERERVRAEALAPSKRDPEHASSRFVTPSHDSSREVTPRPPESRPVTPSHSVLFSMPGYTDQNTHSPRAPAEQDPDHEPAPETPRSAGVQPPEPGDPDLFEVLAEMAAEGSEWAQEVQQRRGTHPLSEREKAVLRSERDKRARRRAGAPPPDPIATATPEARRVWAEYRAAMAIQGREVRDAPSKPELDACARIAAEAVKAARDESDRPGRKGPTWRVEAVESDWIARWVAVDERAVAEGIWPLPMLPSRLSRFGLKGRKPPTESARTRLARRDSERVERLRVAPAPEPVVTQEQHEQAAKAALDRLTASLGGAKPANGDAAKGVA